jgi:hypothetical protein
METISIFAVTFLVAIYFSHKKSASNYRVSGGEYHHKTGSSKVFVNGKADKTGKADALFKDFDTHFKQQYHE